MWGDGFLRKGGFAFSISCVRTVRAHTVCSCRTNGLGDGRLRRFCFFVVCPPISDRVCAYTRTPPPPFRKNPVGWRRRFGEGGVKKSEVLVYLCC